MSKSLFAVCSEGIPLSKLEEDLVFLTPGKFGKMEAVGRILSERSSEIAKKLASDKAIPFGTIIKEIKKVAVIYPEDEDEDRSTTVAIVLDKTKEALTSI